MSSLPTAVDIQRCASLHALRFKGLRMVTVVLWVCFLFPTYSWSNPTSDSLSQVLQSIPEDTNRVRVLNQLAFALRYEGDSSLSYLNEALVLSQSLNDRSGEAYATYYLALVHRKQGRYEQALEQYFAALVLYQELGKLQKQGSCYNDLGICFKRLGRYRRALEFYQKSLEVDIELGSENDQSISLNNIGSIHYHLGDYQEALTNYYASLDIKNRLNDSLGMAASYNNLGLIFDERGQPEKAIGFYEKAAGIYQRSDYPRYRAICVNNIGAIYLDQNKFKQALEYFKRSLEIRIEVGDESGQAGTLHNLGLIAEELGNMQKAQAYYKQGLQIREALGEKAGIAEACNSLGSFFTTQGDYKQAISYLERALSAGNETGALDLILASTENLARCYSQVGAFEEAFDYQVRHDRIQDSLYAQNLETELAAQEYEFNLNQKIRELEQSYFEQEEALNSELKTEQRFSQIILLSLALVIVLLGVLFYLYRSVVQSKKALHIQKTRHSEILNSVNDIIYRTNYNGDFTYANSKLLTMIKQESVESMIGLNVFDLVREDYQTQTKEFYHKQFKNLIETSYYEFPLKTADGSELWMGQNVRAIIRNKHVTQFVAVARDVTERKMAQLQLEESEKRFRKLFEVSPDAIMVCSQQGEVLDANPAAYVMHLQNQTELIGSKLHELLLQDSETGDQDAASQLLAGQDMRLQAVVNAAGKSIPVEVSSRTFFYKDALAVLLHMRDISAIKEAETILIEARNAAIANTKAKEEFLANMSHEIRTPIHGISSMVHLLRKTPISTEQMKLIENIEVSGDGLLTVINDILDFSKLSAGKVDISPTVVDLRDLTERLLFPFDLLAKKKGLKLQSIFDPELPAFLLVDPHRMQQIINNLLSNAFKFTKEGEVCVRWKKVERKHGMVIARLEIEDQGIGIPRDKQESIFESFSQAESETSRKYGGTGLGLAITTRLVQLMGGNIKLESTVGQGSTFSLDFLFEVSSKQPEKTEGPALPVVENLPGLRVLVAEDDPMNQLFMEHMLTEWGCEIILVEDGKDAVEQVRDHDFDVVLMDVQMPSMDGRTASVFIREQLQKDQEQLPIIALTAHAIQSEIDKCLESGMNDCVTKPVQLDELWAKLTVIFQKKQTAGSRIA